MMRKTVIAVTLISTVIIGLPGVFAGNFSFDLESGAVWLTRNDVRIPGDSGTAFDMLNITGTGPWAAGRFHAIYEFNSRHALRLTLAPLRVSGRGRFEKPILFDDTVFQPNIGTKGVFQFNSYRLTYRYTLFDSDRWTLGFGGTVLIRDAKIQLVQKGLKDTNSNVGFVPLLHLYSAYRLSAATSIVCDADAAGSPQGRAIDAALTVCWHPSPAWSFSAGYRTLEGGADNDTVYTFTWAHYAIAAVSYRF
ncbi:hypothetical protein JW979_01445 [bacterium]|nr:hypothetical protein [candidate division CSSED10-310 bacterium]